MVPYLFVMFEQQEITVIAMLGFIIIFWLGIKNTEPPNISPKGEARTQGTACAIGHKGKVRTIYQCSYITPDGSAALGLC